jgi:hypothetical protein
VGASNNLAGLYVVFDGIIRCGKSAQIGEDIKEKLFPEIEKVG